MPLIQGLALGVMAVVLLSWIGATTAWTRKYDPATMAYWVQAIGSIGAVGAAIMVSALQRRNDLIREQQRDYSTRILVLDGAVAIAEAAYRIIEDAPRKAWPESKIAAYFEDGHSASEFLHVYQALDRLPLHTIPWWQISTAALELQTAVRDCGRHVSQLSGDFINRNNSHPQKPWRHHLDHIEECFNLADAAIGMVRSMEQAIRRKPSLN
ncbi:hypothetical protein [Burkholderia ubonensis]|uniref:hypothetical protein n=1 Tax=Burkholderia ubonensis TaxID=101571 RepID=UPI0012F921A5|nr:hypothetical protein [Burkholderia ubonensis]